MRVFEGGGIGGMCGAALAWQPVGDHRLLDVDVPGPEPCTLGGRAQAEHGPAPLSRLAMSRTAPLPPPPPR